MSIKYINTTQTGHVDILSNALYVGGAAPVDGDDVVMLYSPSGLVLDINVTNTRRLNTLLHYNSFLGQVGTTATPLQWSAPTVDIGLPPQDGSTGSGTKSFNLDIGSAATNVSTVNVHNTSGSSSNSPLPAVNLRGSNSGNVVNVLGGSVGIGTLTPGEAANFPVMNVDGGRLEIGSGTLPFALVNRNGGSVILNAGGSTTAVTNGVNSNLTTQGTYAINVVDNSGQAACNHRASGAGTSIGTLKLTAGVMDVSGNPAPMTNGATVIRDGKITVFNTAQVNHGTISIDFNGKLNFGGQTS